MLSRNNTTSLGARGRFSTIYPSATRARPLPRNSSWRPAPCSPHTKRIYAKLGVHAKQELIELVNRE